jgi:spermidine/putrescine transport system permease protein
MKPSRLPLLVTIGVLVFFYLPMVVLVLQSFNASRFGGSWGGFTLRWYEELWQHRGIWQATRNTLWVALWSTLGSVVLGSLAGWCLHRYRSRLQKIHQGTVYAPLLVPDVLMGISLLLCFGQLGFRLGLGTVIIAHLTFCISYVALVILGRLQDFDDHLVEAARDLGASHWTVFYRIILPLLAPGLIAGALLAFTLSIDDFVITFFVAGPGSTTLPIQIYSMMRHGNPALIHALSVIIMSFTFLLVILGQILLRRRP